MSNIIKLKQHIRTSSRVRRGFRTYQLSIGIDDSTDDRISGYGVYTPNNYEEVEMDDTVFFPELYLFYSIGKGKKILCRSTYIGLDLHSFPQRGGNYIAHALVYEGSETFNPVQVFEEIEWKKPEEVKKEDDSGNVPLNIPDLNFPLINDYFYSVPINLLITQNDIKRQNMLKKAVDFILRREKIIIIDDKKKLKHWTYLFLQIFPKAFVFDYINIASFANSNLLLDVCNILCFDADNPEKAKKYASQVEIIDENTDYTNSSIYSNVLVNSILNNDLDVFITKVFSKFNSSSSFSLKEFNDHSYFFYKIYTIATETDQIFKEFTARFINDESSLNSIFKELVKQGSVSKFPILWNLINDTNLNKANSTKFLDVSKYYSPGIADKQWQFFELEELERVGFNQIDKLITYYSVAKHLQNPERTTFYYNKAIKTIGKITDSVEKKDAIKKVTKYFLGLNSDQSSSLNDELSYLDGLDNIKNVKNVNDLLQKIISILSLLISPERIEEVKNILKKSKGEIGWKLFFLQFKEKNNSIFTILYEYGHFDEFLPQRKLALLILNGHYSSETQELYQLYSTLSITDKKEFDEYATEDINEIILLSKSIISVEDLEAILNKIKGNDILDTIIFNFIKGCISIYQTHQVWELALMVEYPENIKEYSTKTYQEIYPKIFKTYNKDKIQLIYNYLSRNDVNIPDKYNDLAMKLSADGRIKRTIQIKKITIEIDDIAQVGRLSEFKDKREDFAKEFNANTLIKLVKLPWDYYIWRCLFEVLMPEQKKAIPDLLMEIIEKKHNHKNIIEDRVFLTYLQWCFIACDYIVFLIQQNEQELLKTALNKIRLDHDERKLISERLLILIPNISENESINIFNAYYR